MFAIASIGLLTMVLSVIMIVTPSGWSRGIVLFSEKPYFHIAEIVLRLLLGVIFLAFAEQTLHPTLFRVIGFVFLAVGVGLSIAGSRRHREFALKSATYTRIFRPAGFVSLAFGAFVIYSSVGR